MTSQQPKYPGIRTVIHGNGAVAHVMKNVCGGVIGYPITPSTEISELYEAARAEGGVNVWGKHPFFFEPEGEHSAQSGALGAALTGGQYISNASSSQGILYAMESHYVTVGKKIGGFVLQVAARVVSKHSLNVMAGHDDVYALLSSGYTILFGANPQEAADLAAISYRTSSLSLIPVANAMDGFSTSHMLSEAFVPEPELLREYLGDPAGRISCPTVAQELLFGAKGRVYQLNAYLERHRDDFRPVDLTALSSYLDARADSIEEDNDGELVADTLEWVPQELHGQWRRQWVNAMQKGTRQRVPALVDVNNPGLTGPVQNQPDFQAGAVDHRTHFASAIPSLVRQAMAEYAELTGRRYSPVHAYDCDDADYVIVCMGSITDDLRAVVPYLRSQGLKVGVASIKLLQPFPEAELIEAIGAAKHVTVFERSDQTALTSLVTQALFRARANAGGEEYPGVPAIESVPRLTTAIFGLGGHDVQPRHLVAAYKNMSEPRPGGPAPLIYLGSQFFSKNPSAELADLQQKLRQAYPETELMALETEPNPRLLPPEAMRIRFHSVGGYGTIATGKLLTDVLAGVLGMHSKSAPKYGSEKSGAPTNYYITLSPEPVLITNAELEDVEVVVSPDHKAFIHTNPLKGLVEGGTFILQSDLSPAEVWRDLPKYARRTIREKKVRFMVLDAFKVAKAHAPIPELELRMMGIAFIGAVTAHVDRVSQGASAEVIHEKVRTQIVKKFGTKGEAVVDSNMACIKDGIDATLVVDYDSPELVAIDEQNVRPHVMHSVSVSAGMCSTGGGATALFDPGYYEDIVARPFREGTISEAPVLPGVGLFMPAGTAAGKDKGLFRLTVPDFNPDLCTGCLECTLACPDAAIPNTVHEIHDMLLTGIRALDATEPQKEGLRRHVYAIAEHVREAMRADKDAGPFHELVGQAVTALEVDQPSERRNLDELVTGLAAFPVARTRPFFDAMEKAEPGTGGLFSAVIDPWKCTGCLECIEVCGPGALTALAQDSDVLSTLQERFEMLSELPNTPKRFLEGTTTLDGDLKRLLLDHPNFYATTGGHGACRGCGEVTAIRLVLATNHAMGDERRKAHMRDLDQLIEGLQAKVAALDPSTDSARRDRIASLLATLERRLYLYESGPTGNGPAPTVIANATGCSSVYASTMPYNSYIDPWVNSLFQDTQPLAKGIFEGISAQTADDIRALRMARLELADAYDPAEAHDDLTRLSWEDFTPDELRLLPTVMTIGGDGASYDIGFGAMSRVLASDTPIKVLVLNSGAYSNTGGQASTSSFTGQDSDLARYGGAHHGKHETRKELGLLASFHPHVYVCATSTAFHGHFLKATMEMLDYQAPAVMDVYTPCGSEHGVAESSSNARSRLAVESRMHPLFVHDPRRGTNLHDWFSLDGNPDVDKTWTSSTLEYLDDDGQVQLMTTPLTPAEFALGETRFKKQFRRLAADEEERGVPIDEYVEMGADARGEAIPFVYATDDNRKLIKVACSSDVVVLVEDRRKYWQTLQYLSGVHAEKLTALYKKDLDELKARHDKAMAERETSLDDIARAMTELATSSKAPAALAGFGAPAAAAPAAAPATGEGAPAGAAVDTADQPVYLAPADEPLCTDCGTCYQELPQFFQRTTKVIDGAARPVAEMIPGAVDNVEVTPELAKRIDRVKANCDAEIIR